MAPHLCRYTVLFHEGLLSEVDHERVVCRQAHVHPPGKEHGERVTVVVEEETVVAEGRHGQANLQGVTVVEEFL
jgi:hypothetical protein